MKFIFEERAKEQTLLISGEKHRYLFKVRRVKQGEIIPFRNLEDSYLYSYRVLSINRKEALFELVSKKYFEVLPKKSVHIGWCIIEPKNVEKTLPFLNEIGVEKITFIYCERSQRSYKVDFNRLKKIAINSSQQSGRSSIIKMDSKESLKSFLKENRDSYLVDFGGKNLSNLDSNVQTFVVGSEGGFTEDERKLFNDNIVGFNTDFILQSHTAVVSISSILLL